MKHQGVMVDGQLGDAIGTDGGCRVGFRHRQGAGRAEDRASGENEQQTANPNSHRLLQQSDAPRQVGEKIKNRVAVTGLRDGGVGKVDHLAARIEDLPHLGAVSEIRAGIGAGQGGSVGSGGTPSHDGYLTA
jgi:hypothetical protein